MTGGRVLGWAVIALVVTLTSVGCRGPIARSLDPSASEEVRSAARDCDRGLVYACTNLGAALADGDGVAVDRPWALTLLNDACTAGAALACVRAAALLHDADRGAAEALLDGACEDGDAVACFERARLADEVDALDEAAEGYAHSCTLGLLNGCTAHAVAVRDGRGVAADPRWADELFREACHGGSMPSCRERARGLLIRGEPSFDRDVGVTLMLRACRGGDAEGCRLLAEEMTTEEATERERDDAPVFMRRACELGLESACDSVVGEGTARP